MKKFYVKWAFVDEYGWPREDRFNWFETKEEAVAFFADQKARNGGYVKAEKIAEGDYARFQRMEALRAELEELEEEF
jgi:hypothetical protein